MLNACLQNTLQYLAACKKSQTLGNARSSVYYTPEAAVLSDSLSMLLKAFSPVLRGVFKDVMGCLAYGYTAAYAKTTTCSVCVADSLRLPAA